MNGKKFFVKSAEFLFICLALLLFPSLATINISSCSVLDQEGETYLLTADIINSSTSYCINISANNIVFDCQNHLIDGDDSAQYGIYIYRSSAQTTNITIKNCRVSDWDEANVYLKNADGNTLTNINVFSSPNDGINLSSSDSNTLTNITAYSNGDDGISILNSSSNTLTNITAYSNSYDGIQIEDSDSNILSSITSYSNNYDGISL